LKPFARVHLTSPIVTPPPFRTRKKAGFFDEVDWDIYGKIASMEEEVRVLIQQRDLSDRVDWTKLEELHQGNPV
jgi:hypothetical protein